MPSRRGAGGVNLLEMFLIHAASKTVEAKRVFEIGTFLGNTTLNLALNIPDDGVVYTLDLDDGMPGRGPGPRDIPITEMHLSAKSS